MTKLIVRLSQLYKRAKKTRSCVKTQCYTAHSVTLHIVLHCTQCHTAHCVTLHIVLHCTLCYTAHCVTLHIVSHCTLCYTAHSVTLHTYMRTDKNFFLRRWNLFQRSAVYNRRLPKLFNTLYLTYSIHK